MVPTPAVTYQGPGDIVSGALAWWGLRAYDASKIGSAAIRVKRPDTTQQDILIAADGIIDVNDAFFTGGPYDIVKLYDQSGNGKDIDVAVVGGTYPLLLLNDNGTLPAIHTLSAMESTNSSADEAQPVSVSVVTRRESFSGSSNQITQFGTSGLVIQFAATANGVNLYAGVDSAPVAASDAVTHALAGLFDDAASKISVDGTVTTGLAPGAGSSGAGPFRFPRHAPTGVVKSWECGYWGTDISGDFAALSAQQHAIWSF